MLQSALKVGRIPDEDGGDKRIEATRAIASVLIRAIADFTESAQEYRPAQRVSLLAPEVTAAAQFWILQPVEGE